MDTRTFAENTTHDAEGRVVRVGDLADCEAQKISKEFKQEHYAS